MTGPPPPPPPPRPVTHSPEELLGTAAMVLGDDEPILHGRRSVTAAGLARQAVESAVDNWLVGQGAGGRGTGRDRFLCLAALHADPVLARDLHQVWARLSEACHATGYELPPTHDELRGWMLVIHRFLAPSQGPSPDPVNP